MYIGVLFPPMKVRGGRKLGVEGEADTFNTIGIGFSYTAYIYIYHLLGN